MKIALKWTKPRQKDIRAKQILRLKKNSIPTKFLDIEKKKKIHVKYIIKE